MLRVGLEETYDATSENWKNLQVQSGCTLKLLKYSKELLSWQTECFLFCSLLLSHPQGIPISIKKSPCNFCMETLILLFFETLRVGAHANCDPQYIAYIFCTVLDISNSSRQCKEQRCTLHYYLPLSLAIALSVSMLCYCCLPTRPVDVLQSFFICLVLIA